MAHRMRHSAWWSVWLVGAAGCPEEGAVSETKTDAGTYLASVPGDDRLALGKEHSCVVHPSGQVFCWGLNSTAQLGDGTTLNRLMPVSVQGLVDAVEVAAGESHTCARQQSRTVVCWGGNSHGQLGIGSNVSGSLVPLPVVGLDDVVEIEAGGSHTCARRASGEVLCWGENKNGQLGTGDTIDRMLPFTTVNIFNAVEITAGKDHTCARLADGSAVCWGNNDHGQLGDGTTIDRTMPVTVVSLQNAVEISAGAVHTCARLPISQTVCWGGNASGQLGDGTTIGRTVPTPVANLLDALQISAGLDHNCARRAGGDATCWGHNGNGVLGNGTTTDSLVPATMVVGLTDALQVVTAATHSCAQRADGSVVCWGKNNSGQLGDGTTVNRTTPLPVTGYPLTSDM